MESNNIAVFRLGRNLPLTGNRIRDGEVQEGSGDSAIVPLSSQGHGFMGTTEVYQFLAVTEKIEEE